MQEFLQLVFGVAHDIYKVLALETHAATVLGLEIELLLYILHHRRGCRCRERKDRSLRKEGTQFLYATIGRPEIVPPLRYAVCLIYCYELYGNVLYFGKKEFRGYAFGRDVKEFVIAEYTVFESDNDIAVLHTRIYCGGLYATATQVGNLVLH